MRGLALFSILSCVGSSAQNWALLNPAYKYNYSNDGSDTITNQIFVTHIDTLGVDSFRYELNRIGVVCDTCPASLGGPCDGCFVWVDQPQALQRSVLVSSGAWLFLDPDTFVVRTDLQAGSSWSFDPNGNVVAVMGSAESAEVFGAPDSIRIITLSNGDTLVLSQTYGLLQLPTSSGDLSLIGVDGPDVGVLFPEPLDFFDFEVGDVISYVLSEVDVSMWPPDTDWIQYRNMIITSRTEFAGGRMYGYDLDIDYSNGIGLQLPAWLGPDLTGNWTITEAMLFEHHRMLFTYPGEVVGATCFGTTGTDQSWGSVLAEWRIDQEGTGSVSNGTIPEYPCQGEGVQMISPYEIQPRLFALELEACMAACYIEGVGPSVLNLPGSGHSCYLTGSFSHVGNDELSEHVSLEPYPNPANDYLWITGSLPGNSISITDIQGRVVIVQPVTSANERKNVQALPSGVYVLMMEGVRPQRFVVSR